MTEYSEHHTVQSNKSGTLTRMKESIPKPITENATRAQVLSTIKKRLVQVKLKGYRDEIEDHLFTQHNRLQKSLDATDSDLALDIVVIGYELDTQMERGISITEALQPYNEEITELALGLLQTEDPDATHEEAQGVIKRLTNIYTEGYFVDRLLSAIEERMVIKRGINQNIGSEYIIDTNTGIVEPKKDKKAPE
jgi:hypothetical protein